MIKISFTGDISLDKPMLKAARDEYGAYHFEKMFRGFKRLISNSDFLVGNLETVFGGADKGYNIKPFSYNSPDEFLYSLKETGFNLLSVANNHCLDEGVEGLRRTVSLCKEMGIDTVGMADPDNSVYVKKVKGVKIAFLSYTHMVNQSRRTDRISNIYQYINLLYPYKADRNTGIRSRVIYALPLELREGIKRILGMPTVTKFTDSIKPGMLNEEYIERLERNIRKAKAQADLVVMLVHCGGQFNDEPGDYTSKIFEIMREAGVDVIIGNHPHVIQRIEVEQNNITAFSLGGVTLSPSAEYVHPEAKAEYSMLVHIYIDENAKIIKKGTYTLIKGTENQEKYLSIDLADREKDKKDVELLERRIGGYQKKDKGCGDEIVFYENT